MEVFEMVKEAIRSVSEKMTRLGSREPSMRKKPRIISRKKFEREPFRFLDLPLEIRLHIYETLLLDSEPVTIIKVKAKQRMRKIEKWNAACKLYPAICATSPLIAAESLPILYSNVFQFGPTLGELWVFVAEFGPYISLIKRVHFVLYSTKDAQTLEWNRLRASEQHSLMCKMVHALGPIEALTGLQHMSFSYENCSELFRDHPRAVNMISTFFSMGLGKSAAVKLIGPCNNLTAALEMKCIEDFKQRDFFHIWKLHYSQMFGRRKKLLKECNHPLRDMMWNMYSPWPLRIPVRERLVRKGDDHWLRACIEDSDDTLPLELEFQRWGNEFVPEGFPPSQGGFQFL